MKRKFISLIKKTLKNPKNTTNNNDKITFMISPKTKKNLAKAKITEINNRIKKTYIPKHLTNIQIAESPNNRVQIIGQDDKGRQQYFYNKEYADKSESRKYKTLKNLSLIIQKLEKENLQRNINLYRKLHKNNKYEPTKQEIIELVNYFLLFHHIRIGSKQYLNQYGSTGISTLKGKHFRFVNDNKGSRCVIKFKGKKGVINNCLITYQGNDNMSYNIPQNCNTSGSGNSGSGINDGGSDNSGSGVNNVGNSMTKKKDIHYFVLNILKKLKEQKGKDEFMLDYSYNNPITNSKGRSIIDGNDYKNYFIDKYRIEITPKMFRTWFANYYLVNYFIANNKFILNDIKSCNGSKGARKQYISKLKKDIIIQISNNLNNTPEICKKKYINHKFLNNALSRLEYYCRKCSSLESNSNIKQRHNIHNFLIKEIF